MISFYSTHTHNIAMETNQYFTRLFQQLAERDLEFYHKAVFMNMEGTWAAARRVDYYRQHVRHMGCEVFIGCGVKLVNPQYVTLGDHVEIHDHCVIIAHSEKGVTLNDGARLKYGVYLDTESAATGYITIGKRVYIGAGCCLHGHEGLEIGDDSLLAQNVTITPYSHRFADPTQTICSQGGLKNKVVIGRDCYLGMNVCVVCTAREIGEGSVVGAGAVVVKQIPPYSVAIGVPAQVAKRRGPPAPENLTRDGATAPGTPP